MDLRKLGFVAVNAGFVLIGGSYCFFSNNPDQFQRFGSAIVVFALLSLSISRVQYESSYQSWLKNRYLWQDQREAKYRELVRAQGDLSVDAIVLQIVQMCKVLDLPHPWKVESDKEIEELAKTVSERLNDNSKVSDFLNSQNEVNEYERKLHSFEEKFLPWLKLVWRTEVTMLVVGTLQWGYGDLLVKAYYAQ